MAKSMTNVLVAGYRDVDAAANEFDALIARVKAKKVRIEGSSSSATTRTATSSVQQTGDNLGRNGAGWGGAVGFLVGLAAPPLLAATVVGAAGRRLVGKFAEPQGGERPPRQARRGHASPARPPSSRCSTTTQRLAVERALPGIACEVRRRRRTRRATAALKDSLAEAMGKFNPDRTVLPIPDRTFGGVAGPDAQGLGRRLVDDPRARRRPRAPPTCSLVLIDDAGFGAIDTFGGPVSTPAFTRVQQMGLTYNRFHVTAVCSPTRAALLTGRNQHRVGFGSIAEYPGPVPRLHGHQAAGAAPACPRILKENGYVTGGFGKWHLTPDNVQGAAGPFDHWPKSWGFDHWWGFLSRRRRPVRPDHHAGRLRPSACPRARTASRTTSPTTSPTRPSSGCTRSAPRTPHKPWMMFYSTGCAHAPHHVAHEWADKYKGTVRRRLGRAARADPRAPEGAGHRPAGHRAHRAPRRLPGLGLARPTAQKKLYVRQMEVYAGYQENADWNVGRLLDAIEEMGDLDNTLVFYIWGDNGASMEGTTTGSFNELTFLNGLVLDADQQLALIEQYGGIEALGGDPHRAARRGGLGARHATPRSSGASRPPATSAAPATRWSSPGRAGIKPDSAMRAQFTHVIDVGPTILEAAGIPEPKTVDGIAQEPMDGTSFLYTFDDATAPERHTTQYFEMFGSRGMYKDGWWAASRPDRLPWDVSPATLAAVRPGRRLGPGPGRRLGAVRPDRPTSPRRMTSPPQHPDKVQELQELWWRRPSATGCCRSWAACR